MLKYFLSFLYLFGSLTLLAQVKTRQPSPLEGLLLEPADTVASLAAGGAAGGAATRKYHPATYAYAIKIKYLPPGARVLRQLSGDIRIIEISSEVRWKEWARQAEFLVPVNDNWKLSPGLLARMVSGEQTGENEELLLSVGDIHLLKNTYSPLSGFSIQKADAASRTMQVKVPAGWIRTALKDKNIHFIGSSRRAQTERELTGFDLTANKVNTAHRNWPAINGRGLTVSIKENRPDTSDIDFRGRYILSPGASSLMETHATTMATIASGAGNSFYTGKGVAWGSWISSANFETLLPDEDASLKSLAVSVQNHSYGTGIENYYGADAMAYDRQSNDNPLLLHVFSAGNSGTQAGSSGNYAGISGYANITGSFKMAKNNLVVGAVDSFGNVPALSSRGPAYDGRIKPELVAFGEDGSSGAAAIVSGTALLVQDACTQQSGALPPAALVRSILVNSADDIGSKGIDYVSGFGSVNAFRAVQTVMDKRYDSGYARNGQTASHQIIVPSTAINLKVTISWNDPAAPSNTATALVNDLDLSLVHTASGKSWQPWVLNNFADADSLRLLPQRGRDSLNNIEQVRIDLPDAGEYSINVQGYALQAEGQVAGQAYFISWQYDTLPAFHFTYPVKGDQLLKGSTNAIRWSTTLTGTAQLDYSLDAGQTWKTATNDVNLSQGYLKWSTPDVFSSLLLRMTAGVSSYLSDTIGISRNLDIKTGFNCPDSFLIYWNKAAAVDQYRVYRLGDQYLENLTTLNDTALIQLSAANPYEYFTVSPVLPSGIDGMKSYTFNYKNQGVGCYLSNFLADATGTNEARLSLLLGSLYNVKKIVFEKWVSTRFETIAGVEPVTQLQQIINTPANNGLNIYRGRIELEDGSVLYTKQEQVYIFNAESYYVFPNPVKQGSNIRIMTEDIDNTIFVLFDATGKMVLKQAISSTFQEISTSGLQAGIYIYNIYKNGVRERSKKLIIQ